MNINVTQLEQSKQKTQQLREMTKTKEDTEY